MNHTRWINKALLATTLLAVSSTGMRMAHAQDAGANGAAAPITNSGNTEAIPLASTTTTTTPGIPPVSGGTATSPTVTVGAEEAATEVAPEGSEARGGLPNTGGEPLLMSLAGLALAGGALGLRRKLG